MAAFHLPFHRGACALMKIFAKGWSMGKDGPGNRRIYYLKGCNLRCKWCASPESINFEDELLFYPDRAPDEELDFLCPHGAISKNTLDRSRCRRCPDNACRKFRHKALEWAGENITESQIVQDIGNSRAMWSNFAGVTFGGGEPSLQSGELSRIMQTIRQMGIHTAFESNAAADGFPALVRSADLVITDLKCAGKENFEKLTGGDFDKVSANHTFAAEYAKELLIRIPLIPTMNDSEKELTAMAEILRKLNETRIRAAGSALRAELLKLHHFGAAKYAALNRVYPAEGLPYVENKTVDFMENLLIKNGIYLIKS
ncbi:MAG: glycyl-radical enzyme activating protein [Lentisphaeria bacterium]|nr:glycyl-radical enzyme activating protein [Lentisphaeria bacterium]